MKGFGTYLVLLAVFLLWAGSAAWCAGILP
jgi:hypothetical protein